MQIYSISDATDFLPKLTIRNSLKAIDKIRNIKIEKSFKLVSLDVKSLFTSIPVSDF